MEDEAKGYIEVEEEEITSKQPGRVMCAGIYGDTDMKAMADRKRRIDGYRNKFDYREIVPCDRCVHCIELRRFTEDGEMESMGYVCVRTGGDTDPFHTCNDGFRSPNGRRKVVFDSRNAPLGFEDGLVDVPFKRMYSRKGKRTTKPTIPPDGYRGGSEYYKRADGKKKESGTVPKVLAN